MKNKKSVARERKKNLLCSQTLDGLHSIPSLLPNTSLASPPKMAQVLSLSLSLSPSSGAQRGWICVTQIFLFWTVTHIIFTYLNSLRFIGIAPTNEISLWQWCSSDCTLLDETERNTSLSAYCSVVIVHSFPLASFPGIVLLNLHCTESLLFDFLLQVNLKLILQFQDGKWYLKYKYYT